MSDQSTAPSWHPLAGRALQLAVLGERHTAGRVVQRIAAEHGGSAVVAAMLAWIDTLVEARGGVADPGAGVRLAFVEARSGDVHDAGDVEPLQAWAGRLIAARVADDEAIGRALIDTAAAGTELDWGRHVLTLLNTVALNLRFTLSTTTPPPGL